MNKPLAGLIAAAGMALVVTAAGMHPQVSKSIGALATGGAHIEEASLGYKV